jgi:predicted Ser/Thr protein kinase
MVTATKAGRYEILGELGRGGMGVVYRAKDPSIGRTVAVKTIRLSEEGTGMSHAQLVERFQTEARAAGLLTHPNIVVIYDVGESDGVYYITMELVNGKSLQSMLDAGEKFSLPRLLRIMEQVCSALQFAHDHSVVHRDIKPANIMLTSDDLVKITDFGTAKIMQYGASQQTSAMGTPGYMSPEQIKGKATDGRTDIFSLGVMLYVMTTGQKPFAGQDIATILYRILNEEPVPPHKVNPSIPLGVSSTILKALTKSPHLRYENCRELLEDLKNYRPGENGANANAAPSINRMAARLSVREAKEKNFKTEMPQIPGVAARSTAPTVSRARPISPSGGAAGNNLRAETGQQVEGIYAGPTAKLNLAAAVKRLATIAAGVLLAAMLGSYAIKMIGRLQRPDSDALPARQDSGPSTQPQGTETDSAQKPLYVTQSNSQVATVSELAQPWSSRRFFYRSLTQSKYVPALIIRLPGPASESKSYWAFSLEVPFSQCQFAYIDDVAKLSSEYGFEAAHPMVVNPCSSAVFNPLQLKELPGNILVRGAIVKGDDLRPPYGIEVKVSGNQIHAVAME